MRWLAALAALLTLSATATDARADLKTQLAAWFSITPADVETVRGLELPAGGDYTHVVLGRFKSGTTLTSGVALLRCDAKQCTGTKVWLHTAEDVDVRGLVDLQGPATKFPTGFVSRHTSWYEKIGTKLGGWPALVIQTTTRSQTTGTSRFGKSYTGEERHRTLHVLSLAKADVTRPTVFQHASEDHYPAGGGMTATFRLDRASKNGPADIIVIERRQLHHGSRCLRPAPTETRWTLVDRQYQPGQLPGRIGC